MIKLTWEFATDRENGRSYVLDPDHPVFTKNISQMTPMCRKVLRLYLQEVLAELTRTSATDDEDYGL